MRVAINAICFMYATSLNFNNTTQELSLLITNKVRQGEEGGTPDLQVVSALDHLTKPMDGV